MNDKINIIDLFAGAGGLSYGFYKNNDFNIICANEIEKDMCMTYTKNHPNVPMYNIDIKDFNPNTVINELLKKNEMVDLIIGGPPCQAYSTVGKRILDDLRGKLFQEYYRIVKSVMPKMFIFENVKGLLSMDKGNLIKLIISLFEELGYKVKFKVLNSLDYGVPQSRERVILVGNRFKSEYNFPEQTHSNNQEDDLKKHLTLSDAISDLPKLGNDQTSTKYLSEPHNEYQQKLRIDSYILTEHTSPKNNDNLIALMKALPDGGTPLDVAEHLRPKSGFKNTYCRLWWDKPATTITRNFSTPSSSRCIHPIDPRPLTAREAARLQSFPDNYIFVGSKTSKNLQIGNAVPVILSEFLATSILKVFNSEK